MCRPVPQKTNMTLHVFYKNNSNFPQRHKEISKPGDLTFDSWGIVFFYWSCNAQIQTDKLVILNSFVVTQFQLQPGRNLSLEKRSPNPIESEIIKKSKFIDMLKPALIWADVKQINIVLEVFKRPDVSKICWYELLC